LIESFNIKVEKGYVLMRNLKDLVGTEDFLNRLELTFHQFLHQKEIKSAYLYLEINVP
jgi:aminopeptidase N